MLQTFGLSCKFGASCMICEAQATEFRKAVFHVVAGIPEGQVMTYSSVARAIGKPKSQRAVGNALKANPFHYANKACYPQVPCHRVVGKSHLGGFFGTKNIPMKMQLLREEGVCDECGAISENCIVHDVKQLK